jgi:hypothetical protein
MLSVNITVAEFQNLQQTITQQFALGFNLVLSFECILQESATLSITQSAQVEHWVHLDIATNQSGQSSSQ